MRIVIATTYVPFIKGGGTMIIDSLQEQLVKRGFDVDIAWIPIWSHWRDMPQQSLALRCLDFTEAAGNRIDRIITVRYPAQAAIHPNKVAWFIHHHRGAYDLYGTKYQDLPNAPEGDAVRDMMFQYDTTHLNEHRYIYTNSKIVASRLKKYNKIDADAVIYPPLPNAEPYHHAEYGDYFLYTARITSIKRQLLLIEAMKLVKSKFKLVLAGKGDTEEQTRQVNALIEKYGLKDRVIVTGWITEEEKIKLTANAYACLYVPFDEDSYGYSTLEAFHSHKAVITCTDSGGTDEVIQDGFNGLMAEPTAESLAEKMEYLWAKRERGAEMGHNAHHSLSLHNIDWDYAVQQLTK